MTFRSVAANLSGPTADAKAFLLAEHNDDEISPIDNPLRIVRDGEETVKYLKGLGKFSNRTQYPFPGLLALDLMRLTNEARSRISFSGISLESRPFKNTAFPQHSGPC